MSTRTVTVAAGMGWQTDSWLPAIRSMETGNVEFVGFDTLSEATIQFLRRAKLKDPRKGYFGGLAVMAKDVLPVAYKYGAKIITNAGGINVAEATRLVVELANSLGLKGLRVASVTGDDVLDKLQYFIRQGVSLAHLDTGEDFSEVQHNITTATAYLGADPIREALAMGADVVITGRCTDSAMFLGPISYALNLDSRDKDMQALGIVAGHLLECAAQSAGGNFSGSWWDVPNPEDIGYPIADISADGEMILYKAKGTGGRISYDTVRHQLIYEIHDPTKYITPDVTVDFTSIVVEDLGCDRVKIKNVKGMEKTDFLKVLMTYPVGWIVEGVYMYSWPDAYEKARAAEKYVRNRLSQLSERIEQLRIDYLGFNSLMGHLSSPMDTEMAKNISEVGLRIAVLTPTKKEAQRIIREPLGLAVNGPPALAGAMILPVMPPREALGIWPTLVPRELIESAVKIELHQVG